MLTSRRQNLTALVIGIAGLALGGCQKGEARYELPSASAASGPRAVRVATLAEKLDSEPLRATGTTLAPSTTKVMPLVPGLIVAMPVEEGDTVRKGQVLVRLDTRGFQLTLRQAQAGVEGAKVGLDAMAREKKRFEELQKESATAPAQLEQITDKFRGAEVGYKQALVGLDMARKALSDTTVRAPYDGLIVKKLASLGDYATAMPPTVLVVMMDVSHLNLVVSLPEVDLRRVKVGDPLEVELTSIGRTLQATVTRIVPMVDPMTRSFTIIAELPNPDGTLRAGVFARVKLASSTPRRRLLVANEAIVDEGGGVYAVYVVQGSAAQRKVVRLAEPSGDFTEVSNGLSGGERVVLNPVGVSDGDPVTVQGGAEPSAPAAEAARPNVVREVVR